MGDPLNKDGREAGEHLREEAAEREEKIESNKGSDQKKGAERFEDFQDKADKN